MQAGCEKDKNQTDLLELVSYGYLYIPILLFLIYWIKSTISMLTVAFIFAAIVFRIRENVYKKITFSMQRLVIFAAAAIVVIVWCLLSGLGGYTWQAADWMKHNIMLRTLVEHDWPVMIDWHGQPGVISYYIAGYLIPAWAGKFFGMEAAQQMLLLWGATGIYLAVLNVCKNIGRYCKYAPLVVCLGMILFATFSAPLTGIYFSWNMNDAGDGVYWMSNSVQIQYMSHINNLRWVFPQFISGALTASLLLGKRKKYDEWGMACIPCLLYSAFCFAGFALILVSAWMIDFVKPGKFFAWKKILDKKNICLLPLLFVMLVYLGANMIQTKPDTVGMAFGFIDYSRYKMLLILFELSWLFWLILLTRKKDIFVGNWLIPSSVCLFFLPFFTYGRWNDLCMRGSIPALCFVCYYVVKALIDTVQDKDSRWYAGLIAVCLAISGMGSVCDSYQKLTSTGFGRENRCDPYGNISEFFDSDYHLPYQYVCYETDGVIKYILK